MARMKIDNGCHNRQHTQMKVGTTMNIALPEPLRAFVAQRVESGDFGNTSEYIRDLIRKDRRDQRIQRLRALIEDGLASGPAVSDTQADKDELQAIARGDIE